MKETLGMFFGGGDDGGDDAKEASAFARVDDESEEEDEGDGMTRANAEAEEDETDLPRETMVEAFVEGVVQGREPARAVPRVVLREFRNRHGVGFDIFVGPGRAPHRRPRARLLHRVLLVPERPLAVRRGSAVG